MADAREDGDRRLRWMLSNALIRPGFRPESDEDIERMLDVIGGDEFGEDKVSRIMDKAFGREPLGRWEREPIAVDVSSDEEAGELLALHRAGSEELSPEMKAKLDALRKRVQQEKKDDTDAEDDELET
jgi:hypothetical protein